MFFKMDDLPEIVKSADLDGGTEIAPALRKIEAEIDSAWFSYGDILDPVGKEFHDVGYLESYLANIENSLPLFNPDNYKHPEIKKGLQALSGEYQAIAELIRARIQELEHEKTEK